MDVFERGEPIAINPKGYGGTDFRPVFEWVANEGLNPSCLVYLTDMAGYFPSRHRIIRCCGDTSGVLPAPWGETVRIRCN
ncbi:MAG: hypothetical protein HZT41_09480 [Dechloromonas sp.]|nr:MAG: hypothetical protein HZT41_09480 [Dechloromonas sp.]